MSERSRMAKAKRHQRALGTATRILKAAAMEVKSVEPGPLMQGGEDQRTRLPIRAVRWQSARGLDRSRLSPSIPRIAENRLWF